MGEKTFYYKCPKCKRDSTLMAKRKDTYDETARIKTLLRGSPELTDVAHEMFDCPCGQILTWFMMEQFTTQPGISK